MNIALYANWFAPSVGGVETSTATMAAVLRTLGHGVTVVTATMEPAANENQLADRVVRTASFWKILDVLAGADLVISNGFCRPAAIAAMVRRKPLLVWHVMARPSFEEGFGPRVWLQNFTTRIGLRYAARHAGISRTCLAAKQLPPDIDARVVYFPPSLSLSACRHTTIEPPQKYDVVYNGRMVEEKGILVLADAIAKLDAAGCAISAAFAGKGPDEHLIRDRLAELKSVRADVLGFVPDEQLAAIYRHAKVAVVPSTTHPEGMGITAANALLCGCPIIVSDQGALVEVAGDAGLVVRLGDSNDLAQALRRVLDDTGFRDDLAAKARIRGDAFSPEKFQDELARLVGECTRR